MATTLQWTKTGLRLVCETSRRAMPRTSLAYPLPEGITPLIQAAWEIVPRSLIRVTTIAPEGLAPGTWTLEWASYRGERPAALTWTSVGISAGPLDWTLESPQSPVSYVFRVRQAGVCYPEVVVLVDVAADSVLGIAEKPRVILDYQAALADRSLLVSRAQSAGVDASAYLSACDALQAYMSSLVPAYDDLTADTPIDRAAWRSVWGGHQEKRTLLTMDMQRGLQLSLDETRREADVYGATAAAAQAAANAANAALADIAADGKLTPVEKQSARLQWDTILGERTGIQSRADAVSVSRTTYDSAFQMLATYLNAGTTWSSGTPSWLADANLSTTTPIDGPTFRANWKALFDARQALLNAVTEAVQTAADNARNAASIAQQRAIDAENNAISAAAADASTKVRTALDQAATDAAAKASQAKNDAISAINSSVGGAVPGATSAGEAVSMVQAQASAAAATAQQVRTDLRGDLLKIGGGNLLSGNSSFQNGSTDWNIYDNDLGGTSQVVPTGGVDGGAWFQVSHANSRDTFGFSRVRGTGMRVGPWFVVSFYACASGGFAGRQMYDRWNAGPTDILWLLNPPLTDKWQRYAFKARWANSIRDEFFVSVSGSEDGSSGVLGFDHCQVEEGEWPTAYAPPVAEAMAAAQAYADLKKTEAQAYADGIVTAEEQRAINDATAKYNAAMAAAATAQASANNAASAASAAQSTANAAQTMPTYASPAALPAASGFAPGYGPVLTLSDYSLWKVNSGATAWDRILFGAEGIFGKVTVDQLDVTEALRAAVVDAAHVKTQMLTVMSDATASGPGETVQIGGGAIRAKSVLTQHLVVTSTGSALNEDPGCTDVSAWRGYESSAPQVVTLSDGVSGATALRSPAGSQGIYLCTRPIPIDPAKQYRVRCRVRGAGGAEGGAFILGVQVLDANQNQVAHSEGTLTWYPWWQAPGTGWTVAQGYIGASTGRPFQPGDKFVRIGGFWNYEGGSGYHEVQDLRIEEVTGGDLLVDGAITAQKLAATLAITGIIQSPNYTPGAAGVAPGGFKLAGQTFTVTYLDGSTGSANLELGEGASIAGHPALSYANMLLYRKVEFASPGAWSWTAPAGVRRARITVCGAGGGGQGGSSGGGGLGGRNGAALVLELTNLTPGQVISGVNGAAGAAGGAGSYGGGGSASTLTVAGKTWTVNGGAGGGLVTISGSTLTGGYGTTCTASERKTDLLDGSLLGGLNIQSLRYATGAAGALNNATIVAAGGYGSWLAPGGKGGDGGTLASPNGQAGAAGAKGSGGGGGGGAASGGTDGIGGAGSPGYALIEY